tara:strand:+ start:359 stop:820 length:462 start_codon:yes stop_codon:yes gene_type:complete
MICYNNENDIDISHCTKYLNKVKNIKICLVNNNSDDNTYDVLKEIRENCESVSVVNIKKFKSDDSAVKAGARYMASQFNLNHLGFVTLNKANKDKSLSELIKEIRDNQVHILKYNQSFINKKGIKLTMFQSLFPVMDYIEKMTVKKEYSTLDV